MILAAMSVHRWEWGGSAPAKMGVRARERESVRRGARCCDSRMVAQARGPRWRAGAWLWANAALPAAALAQEVACAGRGVQPNPDNPAERCPDWSTDGVCPENCAIKTHQDHCGSVCTAGPTVAVIASVVVVIAFVAGLVFGARPVEHPRNRDSPTARDRAQRPRSRSPTKRDDFISKEAFENAVAENEGAEGLAVAQTHAFEEEDK